MAGARNRLINFWEKPLEKLSDSEWEMLCDGCGLCCIEKIEDEHSIYYTRIACELLDTETGKCTNYKNRSKFVSDCVDLKTENLQDVDWLPASCSYVLLAKGEPLPRWHPLLDNNNNYQQENPNIIFRENKFILEKDLKVNDKFSNYILRKK